jgi:hypothetical protein
MVFLPHGMDQLLGKADTSIEPGFAGLLAMSVIGVPEGRRRYRERMGWLVTNAFDVVRLSKQADEWADRLGSEVSGREAQDIRREVAALKSRMAARHRFVLEQLARKEPKPLHFEQGAARLAGWTSVDVTAGVSVEQGNAPDGRPALGIRAGPITMASWRAKVLLPRGAYRFEGAIRTARVAPLPFGKNQGAGLRVNGVALDKPYRLVGDHEWVHAQVGFEVAEPLAEMELICELRAGGGQAWFDLSSLRVVRLR